ncbi:hypothetical protein Poli38472_002584 [Pythium oligandrum]|uniref:Uncharacterized protein n=1 Tax=Pythium oligandrum TaxID=41045 RepID=A0A8K1FMG8_PYTOL|nr:hypothetical protein Poli38472_002584 [Pythium oligandrum]|eukprot:TMW63643.1 hypothetical protein Poli38472_002584 [Pythium oligandrum]
MDDADKRVPVRAMTMSPGVALYRPDADRLRRHSHSTRPGLDESTGSSMHVQSYLVSPVRPQRHGRLPHSASHGDAARLARTNSALTPGRLTSSRNRLFIGNNAAMNPMIAGTPTTSSSSFLSSPSRVTTSAVATEDVLRKIFASALPTVFDALAKYQYQQATLVLDKCQELSREWKNWEVFTVFVRLAASCESTYHLMRYLDEEMVATETIDQLYNKLIVLLHHLSEEVQTVLQRLQRQQEAQQRRLSIPRPRKDVEASTASQSQTELTELERVTTGDLEYYADLLDQAAEFFALRIPVVEMYRGFATMSPPHEYAGMAKTVDRLLQHYELFEHPLLATLKESALVELRTVKAALETEVRLAQYEFAPTMVALHRLKTSLRAWCEHIDAVTEYPLYDDSDDEDEYLFSGSTYSNTTSMGSTLYLQALAHAGHGNGGDIDPSRAPHSARRRSYPHGSTSTMELIPSVTDRYEHPAESQNPFSRLLGHRGLLLKRGLSVSSLRFPGRPPTTPTDTLEHAILGSLPGMFSSALTPSGQQPPNSAASQQPSNYGFNATNSHTVAAEMMAAAIAKQEREDGYALPVYQWSRRLYRSLVAKYTLYFHRWLEPIENHGDALSPFNLTRIIRSPVGISYLQLMDVLLTKGSQRVDDGSTSIMLILETDKLENKGGTYFPKGYLCPSSNNPDSASKDKESGKTNGQHIEPTSTAARVLTHTSSSMASSVDTTSSSPHPLFLHLEPEAEDDESTDFAPLWGLRGWPAVFSYPHPDPPMQHWPNLVSLIMDNRAYLEDSRGRGPLMHLERRLKTSYYISRVDPAMYLVLVVEGKRRPSEKTIQDFMQTLTANLQHSGAFERQHTTPGSSGG